MDKATLLELASTVEALTIPCTRTDTSIENALGTAKFERDPKVGYGDADYNRVSPKPYTASIDAALTLVPKGLVYNLGNDTAFCWAHVWDDTPDYDGEPYEGHASTLPRAIVAACLRALASKEPVE